MDKKSIFGKIVLALLILVMIVPGVYLDFSGETKVQAAAGTNTDMLSVKLQIAEDDSDVIRFITSVDNLDYYKVGFEVTTPNGTKTYETKTVYERIVSMVTEEEYEFSPKVVDTTSNYFVTAMLKATSGVDYTVRAFVRTRDDVDTKVYGPSRTVALEDAGTGVINMPVTFATTDDATYDVYDGKTKIGTAKVIGDKNVRITLASKKTDDFPSATKMILKSGDAEVGTAIYRNYYTSYAEDGADTTWFEVDKSARNFVIASSADLYGFAKVINSQMDISEFKNDTVTLIRDVVVNENMTNPTYEWDRIGDSKVGFAGTFDGDFNTISGILDVKASAKVDSSASTQAHGLFAYIVNGGTAKNFKLVNSKFEFVNATGNSYGNNNAAVCGYLQGNLENIYVGEDVTVQTNVNGVGGLAGMNSLTSTTQTPNHIKNCWFAGTITGTTGAVGGILGWGYRGSSILENCLNTGTVISSGAGVAGGLVGQANGTATVESGTSLQKNRMTITNSISAGTVKSANTVKAGSVIGYLTNTETKIENVYTTDVRACTKADSVFSESCSADGIGTWNNIDNVSIAGLPIVITDGETMLGKEAYINTEFDFWSSTNEDGVWMAVEGKLPEIKKLSEKTGIQNLTETRASKGWYYQAVKRGSLTGAGMERSDTAVYELDSAADLNGFSKILNNKTNGEMFENDTILLSADIDLNPGWMPNVNASGVLQNTPVHEWTPAGRIYENAEAQDKKESMEAVSNFKGIFDGQGHTISGMYVNSDTRDTGLFGITYKTAVIKNLGIANSYVCDGSSKGYAGTIVGVFRGTLLENIYVADTTYVKGANRIGGITGMLSQSTDRKISKCTFAGTLYASSTNVGGILGESYAGTNTVENCLFSGAVISSRTSSATTGGIIGNAATTKTNVYDCVSIGNVSVTTTADVGAAIGKIDASKTVIEDVYSTNAITHSTDQDATFTAKAGVTTTTLEKIKANPTTVLAGLLTRVNGVKNEAWDLTAGSTPKVKWVEDTSLRILMIGNSFCYYYVEELYAMMTESGIDVTISNVYSSGCSLSTHWSRLQNGTAAYDFITTSEKGRITQSNYSLEACLANQEWDVISLQTGSTAQLTTVDELKENSEPYLENLYAYLKAEYPSARFLWHNTWVYEVGFTDENNEARNVPNRENQILRYNNVELFAEYVCDTYDVEEVPTGVAWNEVRDDGYFGLCGRTSTGNSEYGDFYHDGDVGGGQFLNACVWYEVLTGKSCLELKYVPDYKMNYSADRLRQYAHDAVVSVYGNE